MKKIIIFILFSLISFTACSNNSNANNEEDTITNEIQIDNNNYSNETLKVGIYIYDYPVLHLTNAGGFDYDLMHEIADASDFEIQFVPMQFSDLIPSLLRDDIDIIIAAMAITEDRKKIVNFSDRYLTAGQSIAVTKENTNITTTNDLVGKTVGVIKDTVSDMILSKMEGIRQIKRFEIAGSAFISLKVESIDAVLIDKLTGINYIRYDNDLQIVDTIEYPEIGYGIAVRKEDNILLDKINSGLKKIKANGTYQKIVDKYL